MGIIIAKDSQEYNICPVNCGFSSQYIKTISSRSLKAVSAARKAIYAKANTAFTDIARHAKIWVNE